MFVVRAARRRRLALEREENTLPRLLRAAWSPARRCSPRRRCSPPPARSCSRSRCSPGSARSSRSTGARVGLWLAALALGALAFGALGVAIGALARDVRAASLLAFLLSLPLVFLALVPAGSVARGLYDVISAISFVFPFKAALQALDAAVNVRAPPSLGSRSRTSPA